RTSRPCHGRAGTTLCRRPRQHAHSNIRSGREVYLSEWKQFSRPSGVYIRNDMIYVADSESNGVAPHPGWKRGIRIGSLKDGKVLYRIPDPLEMKGTSAAEGIAVDAKGNVYGGEVGPRQVAKHVKQ